MKEMTREYDLQEWILQLVVLICNNERVGLLEGREPFTA